MKYWLAMYYVDITLLNPSNGGHLFDLRNLCSLLALNQCAPHMKFRDDIRGAVE